ncbi:MAG: SpoIVB peptidase S55 domain-containing protein [Thermoanaerobaculia bacterium]
MQVVTPDVLTRKATYLIAVTLVAASALGAAEIMPLAQIEKGMKGYGLTVFEGTKVERFDVEILGVLHNIGPEQNLILARVDSPVVRRAGVIAGMSGSPIYIDGKVIGALAYSWQFAKEPVAGITPIDQMLRIAQAGRSGGTAIAGASPRLTASELLAAVSEGKPEAAFEKMLGAAARRVSAVSGARPISLPLSLSSFAPETVERFSPHLDSMGFVAVPAGSTSSSTSVQADARPFAPGDPIGAVLLNGDFTIAASGTVTHIDVDRVYAFGHPFLDMGEIQFPMAKSEVVTVMPSVASSFKFSNTGPVVGVLTQDRAAGIMGVMGGKAEMIPLQLTLDGSGRSKTYNLNVVRHANLSPLILAMAADTIVAGAQRAAGERTVMLDTEIKLKGFEPIRLREGWAGPQARQAIPAYLAVVAGYLISNEFRTAEIESLKVHLSHDDSLRTARILEASVVTPEKGFIAPGDTVKVRTVLKPYRGEAFTEQFEVRVPDDQNPGPAYVLVGSGSVMNVVDFTMVPPDPRTLEQVLGVLQRLRAATDLAVGLYSAGEGAVRSGVYLPNLPPSMRSVISADTREGVEVPVRYHATGQQVRPLGYIIDGAVKIDIVVRAAI